MMSRKHYRAIAEVLRRNVEQCRADQDQWPDQGTAELWRMEQVIRGISTVLADDNPRFSPTTFLAACGMAPANSN